MCIRDSSTSLRIASTKASEEKGRTMPEVPIMEMPSTIPSLGLKAVSYTHLSL